MPEDSQNLGAMSASTAYPFDLRDKTIFPRAAFFQVTRLDIPNNSASTLSVVANGQTYSIARGAAGQIIPGGEILSFVITTDANAVTTGQVRAIAKGNVHPSLIAAGSR